MSALLPVKRDNSDITGILQRLGNENGSVQRRVRPVVKAQWMLDVSKPVF